MASGPITLWQIGGETMETVTDFIFLGSKITAYSDCGHESKRCFVFGRKVMTNLDSILKNRDITLPTKVCLVKAMVFAIVVTRRTFVGKTVSLLFNMLCRFVIAFLLRNSSFQFHGCCHHSQ